MHKAMLIRRFEQPWPKHFVNSKAGINDDRRKPFQLRRLAYYLVVTFAIVVINVHGDHAAPIPANAASASPLSRCTVQPSIACAPMAR